MSGAADATIARREDDDEAGVSPIGGVARLFRDHAALKRVDDVVLTQRRQRPHLLRGNHLSDAGDVFEAIEYFGTRNRIHAAMQAASAS